MSAQKIREGAKRHWPWAAAIAGTVGVMTALNYLGWSPWLHLTESQVTQKVVNEANALRREHDTMLKAIETNQIAISQARQDRKEERQELNEKIDKQDRRTWQILQELRK